MRKLKTSALVTREKEPFTESSADAI